MGKDRAEKPSYRGNLVISILIGMTTPSWAAVESTTESFVATAITIKGSGTTPRVECFSLPLVSPTVYAGTVTAAASGSLTDANADWSQLGNGPFYLELAGGRMVDVQTIDPLTGTLTFTATMASNLAVGEAFRLRGHWTIADIFGANDESGLMAGANSAQADNILLHESHNQVTRTYFYSNISGFNGWYRDDYAPAQQTVVYPEQGIMVRRRSSGDRTIYFHGAAKERAAAVPVFAGFNLLGTLESRKNLRIPELNLYTANPVTGLVAGNNPSSADNLLLMNSDGTTTVYFYSDFPGFEGWFDASFRSAATVSVGAGSAFFIHRKTAGLFYWTIPAE